MTDTTDVVDALERAPLIVVPLVREVRPLLLKRRPAPGRWSAHEHACHLAVVHRLFFDRLEQMLASPAPVITPYDPGRSDPDDLLLGMDLDTSLQHYIDDRNRLVERLRQLSPAEWSRTAQPRRVLPLFGADHVPASRAARLLFTHIASRSCS
jgi:DinB superfamily